MNQDQVESQVVAIFETQDWRTSIHSGITGFYKMHGRDPNAILIPMRNRTLVDENGETEIMGLKLFCANVPYPVPVLLPMKVGLVE